MTDYELLSLGIDMLANLQSLFTNYMTLLFAFLVTSYFVAHKLDRAMVTVVVVLFTALASSQLMEMVLVNMDVDGLSEQLRNRVARGVTGDSLRVGEIEVRPGDWFLMRNPSPFNMFTDLAPGLFTHVGVVTALTDSKGVRRIVVTDLPERGDRVPATNVDAYVGSPLHYFFLRHERDEVNRKIAEAAVK